MTVGTITSFVMVPTIAEATETENCLRCPLTLIATP